ncbi:MAG: RNA polymerase sigma factor, RpoD/SigA family [Synechococcaceae cyanobacterium]|nr:RNA polymerase sigma factor, RpoD/SigA family [Synechococcaceae cyanobacterium]
MNRAPGTDLVRQYLQEIGRVDLLSHEEELQLSRQVRQRDQLLGQRSPEEQEQHLGEQGLDSGAFCEAWADRCGLAPVELRRCLHQGRRARERMLQANLRLVVAVAKKYQHRGMELMDLVQEGSLGLERAVERFDPTRGFRFSTYAYWWIRQGITRAIACQSRTIRLPVHVTEKLNRIHRAQRSLAESLGRAPSIAELAVELELSPEMVQQTLASQPQPMSLDRRVGRDLDTDLVDLLEDDHATPEQVLAREQLHEEVEALLRELSEREAEVLRQRYGLNDDHPRTLNEIGELLHLSRERVRQIASAALHKLRQESHRGRIHEQLASLD